MAASDKRSAGQPFKPPPHNMWNHMVDAGEKYAASKLGNPRKQDAFVRRTDIIKVRNDSGAARARGEIVGLDGLVTTAPDPLNIALKSDEPERGKPFGVLLYELPAGEIKEVQLAGVCIAIVTVGSTSHRFARVPIAGGYKLESAASGPCDLIWAPSTGEKDCIVNITSSDESARMFRYTLNEDSNAPGVTEATIYEMDATEIDDEADLYDPISLMADQESGDYGYCIKQDGKYYAIQAPCTT